MMGCSGCLLALLVGGVITAAGLALAAAGTAAPLFAWLMAVLLALLAWALIAWRRTGPWV